MMCAKPRTLVAKCAGSECLFNFDKYKSTRFTTYCSTFFFQSILDFVVSLVSLLAALFNKENNVMSRPGVYGFLECMLWQSRFFFWTFSVASTYNIVTMTVER